MPHVAFSLLVLFVAAWGMRMRWLWYLVALLATVVAVGLWVVVFGGVHGLATSVPLPAPAVVSARPASSALVSRGRLQRACMSGVEWLYDPRSQRWFKPLSTVTGKSLSCPMLSVRDQLRADGAVYVVPRSSARP